jgi:hypothetical protein
MPCTPTAGCGTRFRSSGKVWPGIPETSRARKWYEFDLPSVRATRVLTLRINVLPGGRQWCGLVKRGSRCNSLRYRELCDLRLRRSRGTRGAVSREGGVRSGRWATSVARALAHVPPGRHRGDDLHAWPATPRRRPQKITAKAPNWSLHATHPCRSGRTRLAHHQ